MADTVALPRWDLSVVHPDLESKSFKQDFKALLGEIDALQALFDRHDIGLQSDLTVNDDVVAAFEQVVAAFNAALDRNETLGAYIYGYVAVDSNDETAQARNSELEEKQATLSVLATRLTAWIGSMNVEALIEQSTVAADHAYALRRAKTESEHLMSPEKEALAARLRLTGSNAWSRLHGDVSSQLLVEVDLPGGAERMPMSAVRNLAYDGDRKVRHAGYLAELETWEANRVSLAGAMNAIKGEVNVLCEERKWDSPLAQSLHHNAIDAETLEAMMQAARESFPDFRRYLKAKARGLGLDQLAFYDIFAPMPTGGRPWAYDEAQSFILEHFGGYGARMHGLAQRAFDENWIDAEPRQGKLDGAFCMPLRDDESRILANYQPSYDGMSTLAHELGHAYHNLNLAGRTALQRETPMTLAETASTFCQTIIQKKAQEVADEAGQLYILEAALQDACQIVVDISSRFQFERAVFEKRNQRPLSSDELCQLMLQAQRDTYGDGLDGEQLHAYMWAVKPHYYSGGLSFYNYPYMFGLLFGLGLYARYLDDPDTFQNGYDDLLGATGMADAAELAARFDIDTRTPDFWRASLDVVRDDIDRFEQLVQSAA